MYLEKLYAHTAWDMLKIHMSTTVVAVPPDHGVYDETPWASAMPFLYAVLEQSVAEEVPSEIALLPFILSRYSNLPKYDEHMGLWRIQKANCSDYGLSCTSSYDERLHPVLSTRAVMTRVKYFYDQTSSWTKSFYLFCQEQHVGQHPDLINQEAFERAIGVLKYQVLYPSSPDGLPNIAPYPFFESLSIPAFTNIPAIARLSSIDDDLWLELNSFYRSGYTSKEHNEILVPQNSTLSLELPQGKTPARESSNPLTTTHARIMAAYHAVQPQIETLSPNLNAHYLTDTT
jgi:hypothetical protein